jgi:hypothetical protein
MFRRSSSRIPLALLFGAVALVLLYLAMPPYELSSSTYVAAAVLIAGMAIVTFNTANNAQPNGNVGQILYGNESRRPALVPAKARRKAREVSRW